MKKENKKISKKADPVTEACPDSLFTSHRIPAQSIQGTPLFFQPYFSEHSFIQKLIADMHLVNSLLLLPVEIEAQHIAR